MSTSSASFLQSDININDPAVLRKRISDLEAENKRLKDNDNSSGTPSALNKGSGTLRAPGMDKDWMNFGSQPIERPTTASGG